MATLRERVTAFLAPPVKPDARAVSMQRAQERYRTQYLGLLGQRVENEDTILRAKGGADLKLYADIHDDERAYSAFQQRRLAVVSRPWTVEPGGDDAASKAAADHLRAQLDRIGWDRVCVKMLFGVWYGYAVGEPIWDVTDEGLIGIERIDVPDRAWFGFDATGGLRIIDVDGIRDEPVPDRKFWSYSSGADNDFQPYGVGLGHWLYWPVFFKRGGLPAWLRFLDRFGAPTVVGKAAQGQLDSDAERRKVLAALSSISSNGVVALPHGMEAELLSAASSGTDGYLQLVEYCDQAITRVILSQTMTTEDGSSRSQAEVHMDVRQEITRSDSDLLCESFNRSIGTWLTEWNFPGAKPPRLYRAMEDEEDLDVVASRDEALKRLGWVRKEESFREVYGEGYERAPEPEPVAPPGVNRDEVAFAADDLDMIDRLSADMASQGDRAIRAFVAPLKDKLAGVDNPELLRIALLNHLETADMTAFGSVLARGRVVARAIGQAGVGQALPPEVAEFAARRGKGRERRAKSKTGKGGFDPDAHPRDRSGRFRYNGGRKDISNLPPSVSGRTYAQDVLDGRGSSGTHQVGLPDARATAQLRALGLKTEKPSGYAKAVELEERGVLHIRKHMGEEQEARSRVTTVDDIASAHHFMNAGDLRLSDDRGRSGELRVEARAIRDGHDVVAIFEERKHAIVLHSLYPERKVG